MLFNSLIFLFQFLPLLLLLYFILPAKTRNSLLLIASLLFYAWGGISLAGILIAAVFLNYFAGRILQKNLKKKNAVFFLFTAISLNLLLLLYFKYMPFIGENLLFHGNPELLRKSGFLKIIAPLGLSFLVFQAISYLVDIYHEKVSAEKNILRVFLYFMFFPKVLSGPILRYDDFYNELLKGKASVENLSNGISRFCIGLAKKIIIANTFAVVADEIFKLPITELGIYTAWLGAISYFFQIYFDFSGYTDMALGIALMFGIKLPENFNYPYVAQSIQDFWQRWHITLSAFLRDYLFSPLSIKMRNIAKSGLVLALMITFTLCGLWHGAGWNYIVWGAYFGVFLSIEAIGFSKILKKLHFSLRSIYVILIVIIGWVIFRSETLLFAKNYLSLMFGFAKGADSLTLTKSFFKTDYLIVLFVAVIGSSGLVQKYCEKAIVYLQSKGRLHKIANELLSVIYFLVIIALFLVSVMYISSGSYSPFIYFRF